MKSLAFIMDAFSCLCLLWLFYSFHRVKRMMKSYAWIIIHTAFIVLFCKWIFDAWILYEFPNDKFTLIHELLTLIFAIGVSIGFHIFCYDFAIAKRLSGKFKSSSADQHKVISSELVEDLDKESKKGEKNAK